MEADRRLAPPWQPWEAIPVALVAVAATFVVAIAITAVSGGQGGAATQIVSVAFSMAFAGFSVLWVSLRYPGAVPALGIRSARPARDLAFGAWAGLGIFGIAGFVVLPLIQLLWRLIAGSPPPAIDQNVLPVDPSAPQLILGMLAAVVAAPIGEEIFFRGFLFGSLRRRLGFLRAAIISSVVFALVHVDPQVVLTMCFVGFGFATIYDRRGSLVASIGAHALFNLIGYTLLVMERT